MYQDILYSAHTTQAICQLPEVLDVRHRRAAASRSNAVPHPAEAGRTRTSRHPLGRLQPQVAHQCYQAPIGLYRVPACSCTTGRQGPKGRNDCLQALALQASVTCDYSCSHAPKSSTVWPKRPPAEPLLQVSVTRCSHLRPAPLLIDCLAETTTCITLHAGVRDAVLS